MSAGTQEDLTDREVEQLTRRGPRLAQFTVVYNIAKGVLAVIAGPARRARLAGRVRRGLPDRGRRQRPGRDPARGPAANGEADEAKERRTLKAVAVTFWALAAYFVIEVVAICSTARPRTTASSRSCCSCSV
ncbi:hypothetical protein [Kineosporia sp. R_H_3]|uniref:hypothetical protein n=1 Tax=Kineosporia sp. R_H_3 TaxID=1961848 RepID=UPI0018E99778|nr:hypothetical protein [Kineosporia sp. R_H_3]